jgi:glycosyltransferase involved in cell wall biosynthesis
MRIGIDSHAAERDGSGNCTYIRGLLRALLDLDAENEYILYVVDQKHRFYQEIRPDDRIRLRPLPVESPLARIPFFLGWASLRDRLDVLHVQFIAPPWHGGRLVATVHDLAFLRVPETFSRFFVFRSRVLVQRTARRADRIITGSRFSQHELAGEYGLPLEKISVIPYGISSRFGEPRDRGFSQAVLRKYRIRPPYILSVGRLNPRKNLVSLAVAFARLKAEAALPHSLVLAGKNDYRTASIVASLKETAGRDIVLAGYIEDEDLPALYQGADVFVYPSLFEGVGLPPLEAMSAGVPVVTSNSSSLPETVGEAGILVDPLNEAEIAGAILRLTRDKSLREELIRKGRMRAAGFSWPDAARRTLKTYQDVVSGA